jgi:hypothetical protein
MVRPCPKLKKKENKQRKKQRKGEKKVIPDERKINELNIYLKKNAITIEKTEGI